MAGSLFTSNCLDVQAYVAQKFAPAEMRKRDGKTWLIRQRPIEVEGGGNEWSWCASGDMIRIPLIPYCSVNDDPATLVGYAFQLGLRAREFVMPDYELVQTHLSVGSPVEQAKLHDQDVLRMWLGFAFVLKEKSREVPARADAPKAVVFNPAAYHPGS